MTVGGLQGVIVLTSRKQILRIRVVLSIEVRYAARTCRVSNQKFSAADRVVDGNNGHIKGFVHSDRRIELVKMSTAGFHLTHANLPILAVKEKPGTLALRLEVPGSEPPHVSLRSDRQMRRATLRGQDLKIGNIGRTYDLELPPFTKESELILYFMEANR